MLFYDSSNKECSIHFKQLQIKICNDNTSHGHKMVTVLFGRGIDYCPQPLVHSDSPSYVTGIATEPFKRVPAVNHCVLGWWIIFGSGLVKNNNFDSSGCPAPLMLTVREKRSFTAVSLQECHSTCTQMGR